MTYPSFSTVTGYLGDQNFTSDNPMETVARVHGPAMDGRLGITAKDAIEKLIAAKRAANRRERYLRELQFFLKLFTRGREDWPLERFTIDVIEDWFSQRHYSPSGYASCVGKISTLFGFAMRRRWVRENPCWCMEKVRIDRQPPRILTVDQCKTLLEWCQINSPKMLAYLVTCLMCGVRPDEACAVSWSDVSEDFRFINVNASASKVRTRRIITLEPGASAWLKAAKDSGALLPAPYFSRRYWIVKFREALNLPEWPQDLLRHTNASYWLALRQDAGYVAMQMGNSAPILHRHYKQVVTKEQAEAFWSL